jgi:GTP pyrophosphokinase
VVTAKARAAVRRHIRARERQGQVRTGKALFGRILKSLKLDIGEDAVATATQRLKLADAGQLYVALARGALSDEAVMEALIPGSSAHKRRRRRRMPAGPGSILVAGSDASGMQLAGCCMPVPGDRIVGIRTPGEGIMVHSIDCPVLGGLDNADWVDLGWDPDAGSGVGRLLVTVMNEPGALAQVTELLARLNANIVNLRLDARDRAHHVYVLDVEVEDSRHLADMLASLRVLSAVISADRARGDAGLPGAIPRA